ncbi:MAG TPA: TIGR03013 family XrtA/PEP-CTERM system glycosyltransferase [Vicinamibacterales bacterium]
MLTFLLQSVNARAALLVGLETVLLVGSVGVSASLLLGSQQAWSSVGTADGVLKAVLIAVVCQACLYYENLYDLRIVADRRELFARTFHSLAAASLILAALYFLLPALGVGRGVALAAALLVMATIPGWRVAFESVVRRAAPRERLLIVGTSPAALSLATELTDRRYVLGLEIVGFVTADPLAAHGTDARVLGEVGDIPAIVRDQQIDRVVVSLANARGTLPMDRLLEMKLDGVTFDHLASVYERYTGKIAVENLRPSWLIFSAGFQTTRALLAVKRTLDIAVSLAAIVVLLPVMAIVAVAVRLSSAGPALYRQRRVGQRGAVFTLLKFRSMRMDAEADSGAVWSRHGDPRVTAVGRFLRQTRLDELPQLWNVLRGDMCLVGPRPERPEFVQQLTSQIPYYGQRHIVKPGLTGWAQVRYSYGSSVEDAMEKLQYDLFYIKHMSLGMDLVIALSTIKTVLSRRGV